MTDVLARRARVTDLLIQSHDILKEAIAVHVTAEGKHLTKIVLLFSGGDDSTVMAHIFRNWADMAAHISTGIYVMDEYGDDPQASAALTFVRDTCASWDLPLQVEHGDDYRQLVLEQGFPGPAQHFKMYQRLKERGLRKLRNSIITHSRRERVVFIAGRRRDESKRRENVPAHEREGSIVWASPMVHWTKADLTTYREMYPEVPRNPVSVELHMSGECLCGAFARKGELDEIEFWRPATAAYIHELEAEVLDAGNAPAERCIWGWGAYRRQPTKVEREALGPLCSNCPGGDDNDDA